MKQWVSKCKSLTFRATRAANYFRKKNSHERWESEIFWLKIFCSWLLTELFSASSRSVTVVNECIIKTNWILDNCTKIKQIACVNMLHTSSSYHTSHIIPIILNHLFCAESKILEKLTHSFTDKRDWNIISVASKVSSAFLTGICWIILENNY